eukprot:TRINITY_DN4681_c0_g1_i1.p1 TRINITY_DN4681_c0_g1~~TRINITY_DN4681_c0_g1_i1.p1  ORF type:complete len:591 (+),score=160.58 TRINITY_DN4681_c0_g1_i1:377-2149(+)
MRAHVPFCHCLNLSPVHSFLMKRVRVHGGSNTWLGTWFGLFPHGACVGELLLLVLVLGLYVFWSVFWPYFVYNRMKSEDQLNDDYLAMHVAARVLGHVSTLSMSLAILPVARNSLWENVFGVPVERMIKYHRVLAGIAYLAITAHTAVWLIKWALQGILWHNLIAITELRVAPGIDNTHWDNFTVVTSEVAWIITTIMVVLAVVYRRTHYELFYYTHYAAIGLYLTALIHAWCFWMFALPGLVLWLFDRVCRISRTKVCVSVRNMSLVENPDGSSRITTVVLPASTFSHFAAQYVYINFPSISALQWHPFTISSPPSAPFRTLHIKDMGPGTFTHEVALLAHQAQRQRQRLEGGIEGVDVLLDGPYGRQYGVVDCERLVLVAGGIGVTPLISIFSDLHYRYRCHHFSAADLQQEWVAAPSPRRTRSSRSSSNVDATAVDGMARLGVEWPSQLVEVVLLWIVRHPSELSLFAENLMRIVEKNSHQVFRIMLYVTGLPSQLPASRSAARPAKSNTVLDLVQPDMKPEVLNFLTHHVRVGRPDLAALFQHWSLDSAPHDRTSVMVCGPESLAHTVSEMCFIHGFEFHSETFML